MFPKKCSEKTSRIVVLGALGGRRSVVPGANRPVGVPSCLAPPRPAPPRPAPPHPVAMRRPAPTRLWYVRVLDSTSDLIYFPVRGNVRDDRLLHFFEHIPHEQKLERQKRRRSKPVVNCSLVARQIDIVFLDSVPRFALHEGFATTIRRRFIGQQPRRRAAVVLRINCG